MIVMGHIIDVSMHVRPDTPVSASLRADGTGVTVELGDRLNGVRLVIWDVAELDRLAAVIAAARTDLAVVASKVAA